MKDSSDYDFRDGVPFFSERIDLAAGRLATPFLPCPVLTSGSETKLAATAACF